MSLSKRKLTHSDYTVGWISALPLEMAAAKAMLDDVHTTLPTTPNDNNAYCLGEIGDHNVVISCLPSGVYGHTSAAVVAQQMLSTFPAIRFALLVGIGGGVPGGHADIRLGDVVVSEPTQNFGGVVQYDYGKRLKEDKFHRTGTLNKPPEILLTAVTSLKADHLLGKSRVMDHLNSAAEEHPRSRSSFVYPGREQDVLFEASYQHEDGDSSCLTCDSKRRVYRDVRPSTEPQIHYGLIGTANQVMKDADIRDNLAKEMGILCYEMEAAGIMDHLQCLVVRGICDYSDSHKNKQWQNYAAATAAAYTKELLRFHVPKFANLAKWESNAQKSFHSKVPISKSKILGRETELQLVRESFVSAKECRQMTVIYGLSGYGKTQLALDYLTKEKTSYQSSFWVDGSSNAMLEESFVRMSSHIRISAEDHQTTVDKVKEWFEEENNTSWIIVVDGIPSIAEETGSHELDLRRYLPICDHGHVLLTTTASNLHLQLGVLGVQMNGVDEQFGSEIILRSARILRPNQQTFIVAKAISRKLGGVPLALEQAGYFLWKEQIPIAEYNEHFTKIFFDKTLRSPMGKYIGSYEKGRTLWAALDMSHRALSRRSPEAIRLLSLTTFLGHGVVRFSLITENLSNHAADTEQEFIEMDGPFPNTLNWLRELYSHRRSFVAAINEMEDLGFVRFNRSTTDTVIESFFVHDLVQSFIKSKASATEKEDAAAASLWLNGRDISKSSSWHKPQALMKHMGRLSLIANSFTAIVPRHMVEDFDGKFSKLCCSVAPVYARICRLKLDFGQARYFWRIWYTFRSYAKGSEAFTSRMELENLLQAAAMDIKQGFLDDGIGKYENFLQECTQVLPDEDELIATAAGALRDARELSSRSENQIRRVADTRGHAKPTPGRNESTPDISDKEWELLTEYEHSLALFGSSDGATAKLAAKLAEYYHQEDRPDKEEEYREVIWKYEASLAQHENEHTPEELRYLHDLCICSLRNGNLMTRLKQDLYLAPTWIMDNHPCELSFLLLNTEGPYVMGLMERGDSKLAKSLLCRHEPATVLGWAGRMRDSETKREFLSWVEDKVSDAGLARLFALGLGDGL